MQTYDKNRDCGFEFKMSKAEGIKKKQPATACQ